MPNRFNLYITIALLVFARTSVANDTLKFAWPDKMQAKVAVQVKGTRTVAGSGTYTWSFGGDYTLKTEQHGEELLLTRANFSGWKGQVPKNANFIIDRIVDLVPNFLVSREGDFRRLENPEAALRNIESSLGKIDSMSQPEQAALANIFTPQGLSAITQDYWSALTQTWRGRPASVGKVELRLPTPIPQLGGNTLDLKVELTNFGPIACNAQDNKNSCISLGIRSEADPEQVAIVVKKLSDADLDVRPTRFTQIQFIHLIAQPDTLIPYRLTLTRKVEGEGKVARKNVRFMGIEENERVYTFEYGL